MARLPTTQRITQEELRGTADQKISSLLGPLNLFFTDVNSALNKNLSIGDNVDAQIVTVDFTTASTYPTVADWIDVNFSVTMNRRPSGAMVIGISQAGDTSVVFSDPVFADVYFAAGTKTGTIRFVTGLQASTRYYLTLLVI